MSKSDHELEFHLEGLRDRWLLGETTEAESARLEAHVRDCRTCQAELLLAGESDEDAMPALLADTQRWDRVFEATQQAITRQAPRGAQSEPPASPVANPHRRRRLAVAVTLGALGMACGIAVAAELSARFATEASPAASTPSTAAPPSHHPAPELPAASSATAPSATLNPVPAPSTAPSAPVPAKPTVASAAELFRRAQAARNRGDLRGARGLYAQLLRDHPNSREARVSRMSLASILRDLDGTDEGALSQYDQYLHEEPKGALAEEALVGRARTLDRLGRKTEARQAWAELLRRYPKSLHAGEARRKLSPTR